MSGMAEVEGRGRPGAADGAADGADDGADERADGGGGGPRRAIGRLLELTVTDLALIERLRLELAPGLNVFTGETGAGKSLLIDALGLAVGARADTTLVRHGAETARVSALFDRLPEPLIATREVSAGGRSTARIDDEPVTAARLAETVGSLVEIHGQHDQQRLLDERWQRQVLDAYGGHGNERERVATAVERWRANRSALDDLVVDPRELERRVELLEHEVGEIAAARREHVNREKRVIYVPRSKTDWKTGNKGRVVPLSSLALAIIDALPVSFVDGSLFGMQSDSIKRAFKRLCAQAGIKGLRFHDLRREAISRLFERGLAVEEVALISGHRTWSQLKRYTALRAEDVVKKLG